MTIPSGKWRYRNQQKQLDRLLEVLEPLDQSDLRVLLFALPYLGASKHQITTVTVMSIFGTAKPRGRVHSDAANNGARETGRFSSADRPVQEDLFVDGLPNPLIKFLNRARIEDVVKAHLNSCLIGTVLRHRECESSAGYLPSKHAAVVCI